MENGDIFDRMRRPTMQQINYVIDLSESEKRRGVVSLIAKKYDVNHGTVSRFFKTYYEAGYIDDNYDLTDKGKEWLNYYMSIYNGLKTYFKNLGIPKADIEKNIVTMIEGMDTHILSAMVSHSKEQSWKLSNGSLSEEEAKIKSYKNMMKPGRYEVDFLVLKMDKNGNKKGMGKVSMADKGFVKPGLLVYEEDDIYLELTPQEVKASSMFSGGLMKGKLESLSYILDGVLTKAEFTKDGKVRIPAKVFDFHLRRGSRLDCSTLITVTCSVGRVHMPESTARLILWV